MSKTRIITVVCWVISATALLGFTLWFIIGLGLNGDSWPFTFGSFEPVGSHLVSAEQIDSISIDWTAGAVYIGAHSGDEIQITEFAQRPLRENEHLKLNVGDGAFAIYFTEHRIMRNNMPAKRLEVLIPYSLSESFEHLHVNTVSGRIGISNINADTFIARTTSGRIELTDISAHTLNASTTSGRIELSTMQAEAIYLRTTSGRIELTDISSYTLDAYAISGRISLRTVNAEEVRLQTTSGQIVASSTRAQILRTNTVSGRHELFGSFQSVNARSTSGRIEILSSIIPESLAATATSGRISVTVPNEGAIGVQFSTRSGRFTSQLPVITHAGADAQFNLSTGSGRISIYELIR